MLGVLLVLLALRPTADDAVVRGRVVDDASGAGIARAAVSVVGTMTGAMADDSGRFMIQRVPAGAQVLRARALGHAAREVRLTLAAGDTVDVIFRLPRIAAQLAEVRTTARSAEREQFLRAPAGAAVTVRGEALKRIPVIGEPDVLRVVQLLPGVVAPNDFTAGYNVRGGESDQNLVLLDGFPLYNPFHFGGLFGTFIDETVADFELQPGVFPARYGTRLSSVLTVNSKAEARDGVHGAAQVSLLASSLVLGGSAFGGRTSWNVAGRRTYADQVVRRLSSNTLPYWFGDLQAHVVQQLPGGGTLAFTGYAGQDILDASLASFGDSTQAGGGRVHFDWGNALAGLAWTQPMGTWGAFDSTQVMQRLSYTRFGTRLDLGSGSLTFTNGVHEWRAWGEWSGWSAHHAVNVGYEASAYGATYDAAAPQAGTRLFAQAQHPSAMSAYVDDAVRATPDLLLRLGLRGETVTGTGWAGLSPRLGAKWFLSPTLALTAGAGITSQWTPTLRNENAPIRLFDFWLTSDRNTPVARARQVSLGAERWFDDARFVRVEGYYKHYDRLPVSNLFPDPDNPATQFLVSTGQAHGVDVLVRQLESRRLSGWIAYSYAVTTRTTPDGFTFAPVHDRRHTVNVVTSWRPGGRWSYGVRLGLGTGVPYTEIVGQLVRRQYDPLTNTWLPGSGGVQREPVGGVRNAARLPLFQRLDLSATRTATTSRGVTWAPYLSLVNAYNARNVFTYVFDYTDNPPTRAALSQFPLLPTFGVTVSW